MRVERGLLSLRATPAAALFINGNVGFTTQIRLIKLHCRGRKQFIGFLALLDHPAASLVSCLLSDQGGLQCVESAGDLEPVGYAALIPTLTFVERKKTRYAFSDTLCEDLCFRWI